MHTPFRTRIALTHRLGAPAAAARRRGLTLTEALIGTLVSGVVLGTAAPSFDSARQRRHLEGVAAQVETDLQHARSLAVSQNRTLRVSFEETTEATCYVVHSGAANECRCTASGPVCQGKAVAFQSVRLPAQGPVALRANVRSMVFEPFHGTVTPTGTLRVQGSGGQSVHVVVNLMGRIRSCSPAPILVGHKPC